MAEGLNRVELLGNLGADPELRVTASGQAILKLRLATSESYLDKDNSRQERTEWHQVTVWGKRGEALAKILSRGSRIFIEGSLRTSSYEKDGEKRYRTEIMANNIILAGGGPAANASAVRGNGNGSARPSVNRAEPQDEFGAGFGAGTDDIPF
jgi:single-strand DNA-binding protein